MMLNDKETGAPLCLMSANLLSAARTGGVPGVAARHLARKDSQVVAIIGTGPINKSCFAHIMSQVKSIRKAYFYDLSIEKAGKLAEWAKRTFGIEACAAPSLEDALRDADVVTIAASRVKPLHIKNEWIKAGATVLLSGPALGDNDFWTKNRIVLDHIGLHEAYVEEAVASGDKEGVYSGLIGGPIYRLIDEGLLPALPSFTSIGQVILGDKAGRQSMDETFIFVACGMAVFDVGWGYELYQTALKNHIGRELLLWETPALA